jgi:restriction endonuclease S subunit
LLNSKIDEIIGKISDSSVRMWDICDICRWASPRPIKDFVTQDIHWINRIKIWDTKNSYKYIESTREKITKQWAEKSRFVKPWDFLMSNSMSIWKPYISRIDGCIHDGWLLIRPLWKTNEDYLFYILSSSNIQSAIQDLWKWAVVNNLNIDRISSLKIPLPPIEKQKNIVSEIEKLEQEKETVRLEIQKLEWQKNDVLNKYL